MSIVDSLSLPDAAWYTDFSRFFSQHPDFLSHSTFQDVAYSVHISASRRIIFFEIPKNASSSIKTLLHQIEFDDPAFRHASQEDIHSRSFSPMLTPFQVRNFAEMLADPTVFKFCVFRNPFERLLSGFKDKVVANGHYHTEIRSVTGVSTEAPPSFNEFIYWIATQRISEMDAHWKPQIVQSFLHAVPDIRIFSIRNIAELDEAIARHIGDDRFRVGHVSPHGTNSHQALGDHYTPASQTVVRKKYADDFKIWEMITNG